ncbi:MAG: PKD domain-containing protein, partial [Bacteroidia bacterium]
PVSSGAFQPSTDGSDFYFAVFTKDLLGLSYATFFGGGLSEEHVDGGTSSFDKTGVIYQAICESCGGHQDMPSTPGVWSAQNGSGNCNNALVKYKMDLKQTVAQLNINPFVTKGCAPFGIHFLNNSVYAVHYKWDFGDGNTSTQATPSHTYTTPGNYTVTLIATDSSTCNQTDTTYISIIVKAHSGFSMSAPVTICKGDTASLRVTAPDATSFNWSPASSLSNPNSFNPKAWPMVSTIYSVTIVDTACNSSDVGTVTVTVNENNTKILTDSLHMCIDDTVKLKANGTYSNYSWSSGQNTPKINVLQAGLYTLSTIDSHGCKGFDSVRVGGYTHVPMQSYSVSICAGQSIPLATTQGTYAYHWNPPAGLSDPTAYNPIANPNASTVYTVSLSNGPCISRANYSVEVFQLPPLAINTPSALIIAGESVEISATSPDSCYWYPNNYLSCSLCDTTIASPEENMIYYCSVMDLHGCVNTSSVAINILPTFYVPNTFTPNDDGKNDVFRPVFTGYVQLSVGIFDRWGEEIYHYNTLDGGWNGMSRGSRCQVGVYVYKIIAVDYMDNTIERIGTITLLK